MTSSNKRNGREMKHDKQVPLTGTTEQAQQALEDGLNAHGEKEHHVVSEATNLHPPTVSSSNEPDLGMTIRRLREERRLSLREVAARSGLTQSFLSQVERNITSPSVASLRMIAQAFGVPLAAFFQGPVTPADHVVRRSERRQLVHPKRQWRDYLLTPNLTGKLQVILSVIEPGCGSGDEPYSHDSDEECVVILRGQLEFWIGTDWYLLEEGDSIVFESRIPHRNRNPGPEQAEVLWITTPPSY